MEVHNAIKYGTDIIAGFRRLVGLDEAQGGVERLSETLSPSVDLWQVPEASFLRNERLGQFSGTSAAAVGELAYGQIASPLGSRLLVVVEQLWLNAAGATNVVVSHSTISTRAQLTSGTRDSRNNPGVGTANANLARVVTGAGLVADGVGLANNGMRVYVPVNVMQYLRGPWILHPGEALTAVAESANQAIAVGFLWRERNAYPSELPRL